MGRNSNRSSVPFLNACTIVRASTVCRQVILNKVPQVILNKVPQLILNNGPQVILNKVPS